MKIMTYNILCGGQPVAGGKYRLEDILAVIQNEAPDILALQEANGFTDAALLERFSDTISLPYHVLAKGAEYEDGKRYHVVVFSRYPLKQIHRFSECELESAAVAMMIETPIGAVSFCNLHLHSTSETARIRELECILAYLGKSGDQLVVGDFNAISRSDPYTSDASDFELRYDVTDMLGEWLVDTCAQNSAKTLWSHPSNLAADHSISDQRRIDYIFATPELAGRVAEVGVVRSALAHRASDHFPVVVRFAVAAKYF